MERRWSLWRSPTAREISKQSASYSSSFGNFLFILMEPQFSQALEIVRVQRFNADPFWRPH
jgi:hypothetical protein